MNINTCHVGDCRELLKKMAAAGVRVQMCVTSPPYFGLRDYGTDGQLGLEATPAGYVAELVGVFASVRDVLADDGTVWLNLGDSYVSSAAPQVPDNKNPHAPIMRPGNLDKNGGASNRDCVRTSGIAPKNLLGIPWRVAFALQADGWYLRSDIIWHKPNPMPESVTDRPTKAHEYLFLLAKSERYYYDADAIKEPATHAGKIVTLGEKSLSRGQATGAGVKPSGNGTETEVTVADERNKRSVWSVTTQPFDGAHFAVFPRALIEPCILAGSRPGDVVLDPFMGSGTTAQVAEHFGRQWIGCEINPAYLPLQKRRLAQRSMVLETQQRSSK